MDDFSLVPVDHQPDFSNISLVPVDHDPFAAAGVAPPAPAPTQTAQAQSAQAQTQWALGQQPQTQPAQSQPQSVSQPSITGADVVQTNTGTTATGSQSAEDGGSWNPDSEKKSGAAPTQPNQPTPASNFGREPIDPERIRQFGELKNWTPTPTQRIGYLAADALIGLGMKPYVANDLTSRVGDVLGLTPLGDVGAALDLIDAKRRDDLPGVVTAAAGFIPGAKGGGRRAATWLFEHHHPWPMYLGGAVEQELVRLPRSLHIKYHKRLDEAGLPRWRGAAHYESLGSAERQEVFQKLAEQTKKFDADYGTKLYDALLNEGFPGP